MQATLTDTQANLTDTQANLTDTQANLTETNDALARYLRGLRALDAALAQSCPKCGAPTERVDDFGATFVCCTDPDCYFVTKPEAN